jgi:energy-coupling factor transporter transmembrane protein EcfT
MPAVILLLSVFIIRLAAKIHFHRIKNIKNLTLLAAFIVLIQILFGPGGNNFIFNIFGIEIPLKWDGFILGLIIICRLCALIVLFPVFTETTSPYHIAAGLNGFGINYRSAFLLTVVFNFIPLFKEEANIIMDAQKLRGMRSFEEGSFIAKMKSYCALAVPLVLSAMRKAQSSSVAMDSRAFGVYETRTWLNKPEIKQCDIIAVTSCFIFCACLLFLNYAG